MSKKTIIYLRKRATPAHLITLVSWWDASDSTTVINDGTGHCSQWNDKSINANNLTPISANPAITASSINSLNVLTFSSGTALQKLSASSIPGNAVGVGFAAIIAPTNLSNKVAIGLGNSASVNDETFIFYFGPIQTNLRTDNNNSYISTTNYNDTTNPHLFSGTCSTTLRDNYLDGTQGSSQTTAAASQSVVDIGIGKQVGNTTNDLSGRIGEVVLFSGANSTDRQFLEGYLAWKWGLQANLPIGHPYKSAAP